MVQPVACRQGCRLAVWNGSKYVGYSGLPAGSWLLLHPRVHEQQMQQVLDWGGQLFMLVSDPARRNGELLTAPISKPTRTSVSCAVPHLPAG